MQVWKAVVLACYMRVRLQVLRNQNARQWERGRQGNGALPSLRNRSGIVALLDGVGDQPGHLTHLACAEAARRDGGRAEPDTAGPYRWLGVEGDAILVDGDVDRLKRVLSVFASHM